MSARVGIVEKSFSLVLETPQELTAACYRSQRLSWVTYVSLRRSISALRFERLVQRQKKRLIDTPAFSTARHAHINLFLVFGDVTAREGDSKQVTLTSPAHKP